MPAGATQIAQSIAKKTRILIADPSERDSRSLARAVAENARYEIETCTELTVARSTALKGSFDAALIDVNFAELRSALRDSVILWMTPFLEVRATARQLNIPIEHVLGKPLRGDHLMLALSLSLELARLSRGFASPELESLFGSSALWEPVRSSFRSVAMTDLRVLMLGESGTGKSALAKAIHRASQRAKQAFIDADLTGVPESLQMDALFGHVKGGYTGATSDRAGLFRQAHLGTLFLDEVCELKPDAQAALLRALQEKVIVPVGSDEAVPVNVRVIAATNRKIQSEVQSGRFREDLFYRLATAVIELPPLRDRQEDVVPLAELFAAQIAHALRRKEVTFAPETIRWLLDHTWPGNVRELQSIIELGVSLLSPDERVVKPEHFRLAPAIGTGKGMGEDRPPKTWLSLNWDDYQTRCEKAYLMHVLDVNGWDLTRTAKQLGFVQTRTLKARLDRCGLASRQRDTDGVNRSQLPETVGSQNWDAELAEMSLTQQPLVAQDPSDE